MADVACAGGEANVTTVGWLLWRRPEAETVGKIEVN
jgi:hypothetical protein